MRKSTSVLVGVALMMVAGSAWAIPTTWIDTLDFEPDILIPPSVSYVHDITDDSGGVQGYENFFMDGNDWISSYILTVDLYDDAMVTKSSYSGIIGDGGEKALISNGRGFLSYNFTLISTIPAAETGFTVPDQWGFGRIDLGLDGKIRVNVSSKDGGDFYLASSTLVAIGDNGDCPPTAPVPEPGTMVLLGFGMLGLAIYGKRRMNKDS